MAEIKRTFTAARMNKDLDERLVKNGEYRDAMNIQIRTTDGDAAGTIQNIQGNTPFAYGPSSTYLTNKSKVIGSIADEKNNKAYFLVSSPDFNITVTDINSVTYWIDSIIEIDSEGYNKTVLNDLYAYSSTRSQAGLTASANSNTITISSGFAQGKLRAGMEIQLYASNGTELLSVGTKILTSNGATLTVDKEVPTLINDSTCSFVVASRPRVLNFSQNHLITGLNVIDEYLFFTDGRSEPKKINIKRCKAGTTQISGAVPLGQINTNPTKLTLNKNFNLVNSSLVEGVEYSGDILEEHVTVIRKAPRTAPSLRMSNTTRDGLVEFSVITEDLSEKSIGDQFDLGTAQDGALFATETAILIGDILNLECINDADDDPSIVRVRVVFEAPSNLGFICEILSITSTILSAHTQWFAKLEQPEPFFELKFPRFGYRYKYEDDEYSSFSPFSEVAFLPSTFDHEPKKGYNLGMVNNLRELVVTNFLPEKNVRPDDVKSIDILYKSTDSSIVYVIKTITRGVDPEWSGPGNSDAVAGEVKITSDMVYKVVPSDQILRSFDNVPRLAKAQEIIANRLIYANYTQNYNLNATSAAQPALSISLSSESLVGQNLNPKKSIKSLRNYKVGFVYGDKYGRETSVISTGDRSFTTGTAFTGQTIIEYSDSISIDKSSSVLANKFLVEPHWEFGSHSPASNAHPPSWADYVKYYLKETSSEYYNLVMDRWYNAEDGNIWISFASADRNKVDQETYLILKNEHGTSAFVSDEARYKIIAISDDAPDFIKTDRRRTGELEAVLDDIDYNVASGFEEGLVLRREFKFSDADFFRDHEFEGIKRVRIRAQSRDTSGNVLNRAFTNYKKLTRIGIGEDEATFDIQFAFGDQAKFVNHFSPVASGGNGDYTGTGEGVGEARNPTTGIQYFFEFVDDVIENKPEFDGRFFVKIQRNNTLDTHVIGKIESGIVYTPVRSYSTTYVDTNTVSHPSTSGLYNSSNYNWQGNFTGSVVSDFAANVNTRFATTTYNDETRQFWNRYRGNPEVSGSGAATPILIDAADATERYHFAPSLGENGMFVANSPLPAGIDFLDFPLDGASRGFAQSGGASTSAPYDILYFSITRCGEVGLEGNKFSNATVNAGVGFDTVNEFYNDMSTNGTLFRFRNDPTNNGRGSVYKITSVSSYSQTTNLGNYIFDAGEGYSNTHFSDDNGKKFIRQTFRTQFRRVDEFGGTVNEGIDFSLFDPRAGFKHDGMSTVLIDVLDRLDTFFDVDTITNDSAIWETEPKESVDLDIYYEASNVIPIKLNENNTSEFAPINSTVKVFTNNVLQTVSGTPTVTKVYNSIVELRDPTSLITSGIDLNDVLVFVHKDGTETRSSVVSFIAADIESSGLVKTSASATGYYQLNKNVYKNRVLLPWSNCYAFGNGVESNRIRDDFNAPFIDNGVRVSAVFEDYKEENITNGFIFSGIYNSNSSVNNLNEFNISQKITKEINPSYGSIQALKARDADLITFTEDKVLKVLASKDALFNADGNVNLTASDRVLGQAIPYVGDYGISKNPESLAADQFRMYFTDKERGAVLRLSRDGLTPISNVGMRNYFRGNLAKSKSLIGSFNIVTSEYNLSITFDPVFQQTDTTVSFNEASKGWVSFKSFVADSALSMSGEYYSSKESIVYKHHVDSAQNGATVNRNTFYGAAIVNSHIDFIFNDVTGSVKNFKAINYEGSQGFQFSINNEPKTDAAGNSANYTSNSFAAVTSTIATIPEIKGWKVTSVDTDLQQGKVIDFSKKEGKWYGNIVGDFDVSNTTFNNVTITSDASELSTQGLGVPTQVLYTDSLAGVFNLIIV